VRVLRAVLAQELGGDGMLDNDDPTGRALALARQVTAAGDGRGGVTGSDGDRLPAGSAGYDGPNGAAGVVGVRVAVGWAGVGAVVDVDLDEGHRAPPVSTGVPLIRAGA
jgi:hypothetical protein